MITVLNNKFITINPNACVKIPLDIVVDMSSEEYILIESIDGSKVVCKDKNLYTLIYNNTNKRLDLNIGDVICYVKVIKIGG